jgi:hypothetical protein
MLYGDLFFTGQRDLIVALTARHRIPTIYHAEAGQTSEFSNTRAYACASLKSPRDG